MLFGSANGSLSCDILLMGLSDGVILSRQLNAALTEPMIVTALSEPIQSMYVLPVQQGALQDTPLTFSINVTDTNVNNTLLIVGSRGTVGLMTADPNASDNKAQKSLYREYNVPCPVYSSILYKKYLLLAVGDGRIVVIDFNQNVIENGQLVSLHLSTLKLPVGIIKLCYVGTAGGSSEEILYSVTKDGRILKMKLSIVLSQQSTGKCVESAAELKKEIKSQLGLIAECSEKQSQLEKTSQLLSSAIVARNRVIHELQSFAKKSNDTRATQFAVTCLPITLPVSLHGTIVQRTFIRVKITNKLQIDWSQGWTLMVIMSAHVYAHNGNPNSIVSYSVPLVDMDTEWERDVEVNLRLLCLPINVKIDLCFSPLKPPPEPGIKNFIRPCPQDILQRLQKHRHFGNNYGASFIVPMDGQFFATKSDFRKTAEKLIARFHANRGIEVNTLTWSDFISSFNIRTVVIKFRLGWYNYQNMQMNHEEKYASTLESAWRRCLSILLGDYIEEQQLHEIIKAADYAAFLTPLSLTPVVLNIKKLDAGEKSSDTMAVELKISCQAPEVVLFTEEAILRRLQELMDNSSNSITADIDFQDLRSILQNVNIEYARLTTVLATDTRSNWSDVTHRVDELEDQLKRLIISIHDKMETVWVPGVVRV
ncbi:9638_t:CDS:10 [Paraglomus brasilianum]|uniref:9638_t:CDS:1 n=1 Tax=Paraglomus brasilianum TaxID=144538 RepID=A0A9N9ASP8_9GLOM|nr:9638_t:CDS:10 [Paraglomus brasilianum]